MPEPCNFFKKETLVQVFSCKFCEISKNTFVHRTTLVAASALRLRKIFCEGGIGWEGLHFAVWVSDNRFEVLYMYIVVLLVGFD